MEAEKQIEKQIEQYKQHIGERQYIECPKHKAQAMRPVEVCYFKCTKYNKCLAVKSVYKSA
jgi:hypothetical protein